MGIQNPEPDPPRQRAWKHPGPGQGHSRPPSSSPPVIACLVPFSPLGVRPKHHLFDFFPGFLLLQAFRTPLYFFLFLPICNLTSICAAPHKAPPPPLNRTVSSLRSRPVLFSLLEFPQNPVQARHRIVAAISLR